MGYASISGRARTSARRPQAHAICDRCSFRYNRVDLRFQFDWAGSNLINKQILVCSRCYDKPQEQLRAIVIAADPVPVKNPRIEYFVQYETDSRTTTLPQLYANITGITGDGTHVTVTFNNPIVYPVGNPVTIFGPTPLTYAGIFIVASSAPGSVTFASPANGTYIGGGVIAAQMDPVTGLPKPQAAFRVTEQGNQRVTQETGEPPYGTNTQPGTNAQVPAAAGGNNPGVPYNFVADPPETTTNIPKTGPLT
jgi:hypothetical protein